MFPILFRPRCVNKELHIIRLLAVLSSIMVLDNIIDRKRKHREYKAIPYSLL